MKGFRFTFKNKLKEFYIYTCYLSYQCPMDETANGSNLGRNTNITSRI